MFFPELIKSITQTDRVLEIGPGGTPYHRADILLEKRFSVPDEAVCQRGNTPELKTDKKIVFYNGTVFPFQDKEFDYVICSHVLEHVQDVELFVNELFRIAPKGYIEFPTIYYEYLYNFPVHLNLLKMTEDTLYYLPKSATSLSDFELVQTFFLESLNKGYSHLVDQLKPMMFEGFEWTKPFSVRRATSLRNLTIQPVTLARYSEPTMSQKMINCIRQKINRLTNKD